MCIHLNLMIFTKIIRGFISTMCLLAVLVTQPLKHITFKYDFLLGLNMCLSIVRQPIFTPTHELNKNHKLNERFNSLA
ncbi:hypothetical protein GQ627_0ndm00063 (plasmid) [Klebsiella pneumoniae]|nr:hypothetical protein GQ627_0ndm00063 [Klebsiella pneumoniae]